MVFKKFKAFDKQLPAIGFGCWGLSGGDFWTNSEDAQLIKTVQTAVEVGVTFFDVAPIYGFGAAEERLGRGIKGHRDEVFIATKCGMVWDDNKNVSLNLSADSIMKEVDLSLKRLGTDYIDLYQMHWPDRDLNTPIEESLEALVKLKEQGKVLSIGLTNFSKEDLTLGVEKYGISCYQGLYNLLEHNPTFYHAIPLEYRSRNEILPICKEHGIPFLPYSPLLQGLLTSHFDPNEWEEGDVRLANPKFSGDNWTVYKSLADKVKSFANDLGKPVSQVAINWLISQEEIGPIICGGTLPEHVLENVKACDFSLSADEFNTLDSLISDEVAAIEAKLAL